MYVEITKVIYDAADHEITLEAMDLDSILLNDWDQDIVSMNAEKTFIFDLEKNGARVYLYKIAKSNGKKDAKNMLELVQSLVGKSLPISESFLEK